MALFRFAVISISDRTLHTALQDSISEEGRNWAVLPCSTMIHLHLYLFSQTEVGQFVQSFIVESSSDLVAFLISSHTQYQPIATKLRKRSTLEKLELTFSKQTDLFVRRDAEGKKIAD